ncbi:MAG: hypothetical protein JW990_20480 [Thermoleophilia bacterium]|nr:hypothetical protein [Thermoleophilia bacterium]
MQSHVKLFVIPADRVPAGPPEPPRELQVEAPSIDLLRAQVRTKVAELGYQVRTASFGPDGLVVYAEDRP